MIRCKLKNSVKKHTCAWMHAAKHYFISSRECTFSRTNFLKFVSIATNYKCGRLLTLQCYVYVQKDVADVCRNVVCSLPIGIIFTPWTCSWWNGSVMASQTASPPIVMLALGVMREPSWAHCCTGCWPCAVCWGGGQGVSHQWILVPGTLGSLPGHPWGGSVQPSGHPSSPKSLFTGNAGHSRGSGRWILEGTHRIRRGEEGHCNRVQVSRISG